MTKRPRVDDVPGATAGQPLHEIALVPGRLAEIASLVVEHERVARVQLRCGHVLALVHPGRQRAAVELVQPAVRARAPRDPVVEPVAFAPLVGPQQQPTLAGQPGAEAAGGQDPGLAEGLLQPDVAGGPDEHVGQGACRSDGPP